jgi:hypothetical protein
MNVSNVLDAIHPFIVDRNKEVTDGVYNSVYRGIIENVSDPLTSGRVQVRVPTIHGIECGSSKDVGPDNLFIPTKNLPWANTVNIGGGSFDRGSSIPYSCGSLVLVVFEGGSKLTPIVIGTLHCFPNVQCYLNTDIWKELPSYEKVPLGLNCQNHSEPTVPKEAALTYRQSQTRFVLNKSLKGHTIWGEDRDDDECFEIIDRNGQGLRMEGFISVDDNKENQQRRGVKSVFSKSPIMKSKVTRTILKEVGNNTITLESFQGEKKARLSSGNSRVEIDGARNRVIVGDLTGSQLVEIDTTTGVVRVKSPTLVLDTDNLVVKGNARFYKGVEVLGNLSSYKRFICNEVNDSTPRSIKAGAVS